MARDDALGGILRKMAMLMMRAIRNRRMGSRRERKEMMRMELMRMKFRERYMKIGGILQDLVNDIRRTLYYLIPSDCGI
jgi:hypothetical protein